MIIVKIYDFRRTPWGGILTIFDRDTLLRPDKQNNARHKKVTGS
jgi:hypothetical protein